MKNMNLAECGVICVQLSAFLLVQSCNNETQTEVDDAPESLQKRISSREDLESFLLEGMLISDLVKSLGTPDSVMPFNGSGPGPAPDEDYFLWIYEDFPNDSIDTKLSITVKSKSGSFSVGDTVIDWFLEPAN